MRIALSLTVAAMALGLAAAAATALASCAPPPPLPERIGGTDVVAHGIVTAFEGGPLANRRALVVRLERVYKGSAPAMVKVSAGPGGEGGGAPGTVVATSVDYQADLGTDHTFYLKRRAPAEFSTDACSGSHPGPPTDEEVRLLGAGQLPEPGPPGVAEVTGSDVALVALGLLVALALMVGLVRFARAR